MTTPPRWRFRQMQPDEMNIDPIEAEFFSTEALGSLADALVREAVQNSLDARRPGERLAMRFHFPRTDAFLQGPSRDACLAGLEPHLRASRIGLTADVLPETDEPLSFVVIEDFGTRGLQGAPEQSADDELEIEGAARNDFFFFWRNIGRSRKHAAELGRWGLGKTVFQAASRINSFFGLTVRADDGRRLLLGQSVLKIHKAEGKRFYPYGYFGRFDDEGFTLPIEAPDVLDAFSRDFGLSRERAPGLSIVVPYPDPDITPAAVIDAVLRHYFMPILARDMTVEVTHSGRTDRLDRETLPRLFAAASAGAAATLAHVFELARWCIAVPRDEHLRLSPPAESAAPRWDDACLSPRELETLRRRFDAGRPIAVTAPVWVKPIGAPPKLSEFDVYLERDESLERADEHFVREGITVTGVRAALPRGIRLIAAVRDRALSALVGDSENPAHTEWQERSLKFKGRYHHGPFTLRYLRNVPRELVRLLTRPAEGRDHALLRQLFSLDVPTEVELTAKTAKNEQPGTGEKPEGQEGQVVGRDQVFTLQKLRGGFRLKGASRDAGTADQRSGAPDRPSAAGSGAADQPNGAAAEGLGDQPPGTHKWRSSEPPRAAALWVAYEVRRGNPFHHYHALDFELSKSPIEIESRNLSITACVENGLVLRPHRPDFELTVTGFDPHRDIRVKVLPAETLE